MMDNEIILAEEQEAGLPAISQDLLDRVSEYVRAAKAEGTIKTYSSAWRLFCDWCEGHGLPPCPATPETVVAYVAAQGERLKPVTVKKHLVAVSQAHKLAGHPSPVLTEPVRLVMQGLRRTKGIASVPKKALRVDHIKRMVDTVPDSVVGVRDRAILLVGFTAGMRRSEIVGLDFGDIVFEPEGLVITIKRSKRDQEGKGRQVAVPRGRHEATCPVRALRAWLEVSGAAEGALFFRLDPGAHPDRLNGRAVAHVVQRAADRAGLDPELFSGHSLRRGFCTEAARGGAAERDIARTTGHRSMQVLRGYVEAGTLFESCAAGVLDL
jgi:site-specific recombinase XerD